MDRHRNQDRPDDNAMRSYWRNAPIEAQDAMVNFQRFRQSEICLVLKMLAHAKSYLDHDIRSESAGEDLFPSGMPATVGGS